IGNTKFSGRKIESGMPGIPCGKPIAAMVGSTSVRSFFAPLSCGQTLGGGLVPLRSQLRIATRIASVNAAAETGFARNVPVPKLLPGHDAPALGIISLNPRSDRFPPPCVEL